MRAGRLKTKRYPVRKRGGGWTALLVLGILLGAGAVTFGKQALRTALPQLSGIWQPSATQAPKAAPREERTFTLPGHAWYALQLGAFDSADAAESLAASFRGRGAAGYVRRTQGQYRVLAAAYATRADAQAVITQLRTQHQVDAVLTEIVRPEVTLLLAGKPDQLTALSDAYDTLEQLSIQLAALSESVDRGKTDRQTVLDALRSHKETLIALKNRLEAQFGENVHGTVKDAADMLDALALSLNDAMAAQGTAALGARLKYAQLQCLCRMADHAAGLAN